MHGCMPWSTQTSEGTICYTHPYSFFKTVAHPFFLSFFLSNLHPGVPSGSEFMTSCWQDSNSDLYWKLMSFWNVKLNVKPWPRARGQHFTPKHWIVALKKGRFWHSSARKHSSPPSDCQRLYPPPLRVLTGLWKLQYGSNSNLIHTYGLGHSRCSLRSSSTFREKCPLTFLLKSYMTRSVLL